MSRTTAESAARPVADALAIHEADAAEREAAFALRLAVFCDEQGVPREAELDAHEHHAVHVVAVRAGRVVGTLRWRVVGDGDVAKIERVAVDRAARGDGVGRALMRWALGRLDGMGFRASVLHAQTGARSFYERLGYAAEGAPFDEDGIMHVRMRRAREPA